ncbi:MAG: hypothetical protein R3F62_30150 [Planctomycetota bacterium]
MRPLLLALCLASATLAQESPLEFADTLRELPLEQRLEQLSLLKEHQEDLSEEQFKALTLEVEAKQRVTVVSGALDDVPLLQALRLLCAGGEASRASFVLRPSPELAAVRVTASFRQTPLRDALIAVLELYPDVVDWDEEGDVLMIRAVQAEVEVEVEVPAETRQELERLLTLGEEGLTAYTRWIGEGQADPALLEQADQKLGAALTDLEKLLYDPNGPFVDPQEPGLLRASFADLEEALNRFGQARFDLEKKRPSAR